MPTYKFSIDMLRATEKDLQKYPTERALAYAIKDSFERQGFKVECDDQGNLTFNRSPLVGEFNIVERSVGVPIA